MYHVLFTTLVTLYIVSGVGNVAFAWRKYFIVRSIHCMNLDFL